ncbi:hypothetical protein L5515_016266 [Caenorhabditis briggsae]|uniref:Uncharacterized protein n=1 Tax=Caenorhabditis briggsae TaxID=6238 RepID=A0AAE9FG11_CAEBR|nr:hypothetical protein L5515_016266 [Caenorhabditis briggsae]
MSPHDQHCVNCITSNCKFAECVIRKCNHCHIATHLCKLEEHIAEVCRRLKHMGRKKEFLKIDEADDLDIQLAAFDQNLITDSYNSSRTKRVKQRDPVHPAHPLIPLRFMVSVAQTKEV